MARTRGPCFLVQMQRPPDADVLRRMEPADIAEHIRLVEVEDQVGFVQAAGRVSDLQRAPRRVERRSAPHLPAFRSGRKLRAETLALHPAQPHAGVVHQCRLVEGDVQPVLRLHRHRRVRLPDFGQRSLVIQVLVTVPLTGRDPPRGRRRGDIEFGQLVVDDDIVQLRLVRKLVAEADTVVVDAEHHVDRALEVDRLGEACSQFVVVVADEAIFAPGLLPGFIKAASVVRGQGQIAFELLGTTQQEAHA